MHAHVFSVHLSSALDALGRLAATKIGRALHTECGWSCQPECFTYMHLAVSCNRLVRPTCMPLAILSGELASTAG
jgi:hypothetical protein